MLKTRAKNIFKANDKQQEHFFANSFCDVYC